MFYVSECELTRELRRMARILRLGLCAFCSSGSASPAVASKLLKSPDLRRISLRWYGGEGVLLEDSSGEGNGSSMAAGREDSSVKDSECTNGEETLRKSPAASITNAVDWFGHLESSLGKLTSLMSEENEAKQNSEGIERGDTSQSQADFLDVEGATHSTKDDKWQYLVSNIRTMSLKKKAKAGDADASSLPKAEQTESRADFSDLGSPVAGLGSDSSGGSPVPHREPMAASAINKSPKQKSTQAQSLDQQKLKDTKSPKLSFLTSIDEKNSSPDIDKDYDTDDLLDDLNKSRPQNQSKINTRRSSDKFNSEYETFVENGKQGSGVEDSVDELFSSGMQTSKTATVSSALSGAKPKNVSGRQHKNQQKNKHAPANMKGKDYTHLKASQDTAIDFKPPITKNATSGMSHSKPPKGSEDVFIPAKDRIPPSTKEAVHRLSINNDGTSQQKYMVCVPNLPSSSNPGLIRSSMAFYGEVTGFFKKPFHGDRLNVYIQFKTAAAMENALAARKVQLGNKTCYITRADHTIFTSVVRICRASNDTDESQLRAICEAYGKVDDVRKRTSGTFDVFYDVKELGNIPRILTSLNEVKLNRNSLCAFLAPILHPSVPREALKSPEGQFWHETQINLAMNRIEGGLDVVSVLFEDLKELTAVAREYTKLRADGS